MGLGRFSVRFSVLSMGAGLIDAYREYRALRNRARFYQVLRAAQPAA